MLRVVTDGSLVALWEEDVYTSECKRLQNSIISSSPHCNASRSDLDLQNLMKEDLTTLFEVKRCSTLTPSMPECVAQ